MPLTSYGKNLTLNTVYGATESVPTGFYARAHAAAPPTDGTNGSEVAVAGYAAPTVANTAANFPASTANLKQNGAAITFGTNGSGANITITHVSFGKNSNAGSIIRVIALTTPKVVAPNETIRIAISQLNISM